MVQHTIPLNQAIDELPSPFRGRKPAPTPSREGHLTSEPAVGLASMADDSLLTSRRQLLARSQRLGDSPRGAAFGEYCAGESIATSKKPIAPGDLQEKWIIPFRESHIGPQAQGRCSREPVTPVEDQKQVEEENNEDEDEAVFNFSTHATIDGLLHAVYQVTVKMDGIAKTIYFVCRDTPWYKSIQPLNGRADMPLKYGAISLVAIWSRRRPCGLGQKICPSTGRYPVRRKGFEAKNTLGKLTPSAIAELEGAYSLEQEPQTPAAPTTLAADELSSQLELSYLGVTPNPYATPKEYLDPEMIKAEPMASTASVMVRAHLDSVKNAKEGGVKDEEISAVNPSTPFVSTPAATPTKKPRKSHLTGLKRKGLYNNKWKGSLLLLANAEERRRRVMASREWTKENVFFAERMKTEEGIDADTLLLDAVQYGKRVQAEFTADPACEEDIRLVLAWWQPASTTPAPARNNVSYKFHNDKDGKRRITFETPGRN
ncbi:hypothetical protein PG984_016228 [Apiospora sp. TS-2023a]